jgi:hypothetical protein
MLPADTLAEITTNLAALNLQPNTVAAILGAVLAPLLRNSGPELDLELRKKRARRPRRRPRRTARAKPRGAPRKRNEARERAIAALRANPDAALTDIAKIAKVSRSTVVNAHKELATAARKAARKPHATIPSAVPAKAGSGGAKTDRRARAQRFLRDELARGPKQVSAIEEAAAKAHVEPIALDQARADLGIVTSRSNAGGVLAVQWSLPG